MSKVIENSECDLSKMNFDCVTLIMYMWLGLPKYIYMIHSIHMGGQAHLGMPKVIINVRFTICRD